MLFILSIGFVSATEIESDDEISNSDEISEMSLDQTTDLKTDENSFEIQTETQADNIENEEDGDSSLSISGNTFEDIKNAISISEENSTIKINGTYVGNGNSIYIKKNITLEGENAVLDAKGLSGILVSDKSITLKNIIFRNSAGNEAVHIEGSVTLINCTFENNKNTALKCKGNIKSDNANIINCNFKNNYIALESIGLALTIENSTFKSNKVSIDDEATIIITDTNKYPSKVSIKNSSFISNAGYYSVFYIELKNSASSNIINNCYFNNNKANEYGVINLYRGTLTIMNSVFGNNTRAIYTLTPNEYFKDNKLTIKNSTFEGNKKVLLRNEINCLIDSCTFKNNNALIYNYDSLTVKNSKFLNNNGAIENLCPKTTSIINSTFTNSSNKLTSVYSVDGTLKIKDSTFKCNSEAAIISYKKLSITRNGKTTSYKKYVTLTNSFKPFSILVDYTVKKLTTSYRSGKTFKVKTIFRKSKNPCSNIKLDMKVFNGKKYVTMFYATANSKGIAYFNITRLKVGSYKVKIESQYYNPCHLSFNSHNSSIRIKKASTVVKAPKVSARFKKSKYFKVTIKNKVSKKAVSKIKVKINVYTGKKYKTYTVKTNKKGIAKLNTKKIKKGKHKVVISSGNKNYIISKKSKITIK